MTHHPLSLQSYQSEAQRTDRTRKTRGQEFLLLGLFGEVGTLMDEVKKKQRDTQSYVGYENSVIEELGDVLWYLSNLANRAKLGLGAIAKYAMGEGPAPLAGQDVSLNFSQIQSQQHLPFNEPTPAFERTLMQLVSAIGDLAKSESSRALDAPALGVGLSHVFSRLVQAANEAGVTLEQAAKKNLEKIVDRWPTDMRPKPHALFDEKCEIEERLPRQMKIDIYERIITHRKQNEKHYVLQRSNGILIGDRVTDNILEPDDYRFHDVFHYA